MALEASVTDTLRHITILGALGDLSARLLLPGIAELAERDELPQGFGVRGVGLDPIGVEDFRAHVHASLNAHAAHLSPRSRRRLVEALDYRSTDMQDLSSGRMALAHDEPTLVYAALPPTVFAATIAATAAADLPEGSRLALEKPFGRDRHAAETLDALVVRELTHVPVSRVDHFLADELPRRAVELRRSNPLLAAAWSNRCIERVYIVWDETLGMEGRGYYDTVGALRDVLQSHLLAVLSLVAAHDGDAPAEAPARAAALGKVLPLEPSQISRRTMRGRYTAGSVGGRAIRAYADEPGVDPARGTETFAQVALELADARWESVPFTLRTGKALPADRGEITVTFRPAGVGAPNELRVGLIEPFARLSMTGRDGRTEAVELGGPPRRSPYANVVLELLAGRDTWMASAAEVAEQWRIVQPVLDSWRAGLAPLRDYPAGSDPDPARAAPAAKGSSRSDRPRFAEPRRQVI